MFEKKLEGLKECPFCGSNAILETFTTALEKKPRFRVKCIACWCMTDWNNWSEDEAKNKWNSRAGDDSCECWEGKDDGQAGKGDEGAGSVH